MNHIKRFENLGDGFNNNMEILTDLIEDLDLNFRYNIKENENLFFIYISMSDDILTTQPFKEIIEVVNFYKKYDNDSGDIEKKKYIKELKHPFLERIKKLTDLEITNFNIFSKMLVLVFSKPIPKLNINL